MNRKTAIQLVLASVMVVFSACSDSGVTAESCGKYVGLWTGTGKTDYRSTADFRLIVETDCTINYYMTEPKGGAASGEECPADWDRDGFYYYGQTLQGGWNGLDVAFTSENRGTFRLESNVDWNPVVGDIERDKRSQ